jgi:hypothetical protein
MVSASGQAVFAVVAKDAASKVLKGVGKSFGSMKSNALSAFKAVGAAALTAGAALAAFTIGAIKGAMDDEKQTIRLNAALKARGFAMDSLGPKIDEQIKAMARLGFTDDQVRDGLEVGSRFFKSQNKLLKANALAANISAATGKDLSTVMLAIGKGTQGSTRGLATLGIEIEKGATLTDILTAGNEKYKDVAEEIANSTSGKFEAAQIRLNESFESFGAKFLPKVNDALEWMTTNILPGVETAMDNLGGAMVGVIDNLSAPGGLFDSVGEVAGSIFEDLRPELEALVTTFTGPDGLFTSVGKLIGALWGDGDGALAGAFKLLGGAIEIAFALAKPFFDAIKWLVDNITTVLDAMNKVGMAKTVEKGAALAQDSTVFSMGTGVGGGGGATPTGGYTSGYGVVPVSITIGNKAQSDLGYKYGMGVTAATGTRTGGR